MSGRIYVTGDTHGAVDRFNIRSFPEQKELDREDYIVVLGDFGLVWEKEEDGSERFWLDWLESKPFTTLFIDGNHDNHKRLASFPVEEWNGGKVHKVRPHVIHLMRGQVFELCGKTIFTFGGAQSHDIDDGVLEASDPRIKTWRKMGRRFRIKDVTWWEEELPSAAEKTEGIQNLAKYNNEVDFVFTHECPQYISLAMGFRSEDDLSLYLRDLVLLHGLIFTTWYFGHYHLDEPLTGYSEYIPLYYNIKRIV